MTRPTDAAIAWAFYEACDKGERYFDELWVIDRARQIDAEAGGTDVHTIPEKGTTPPERVQIPAESERGYCPLCTGNVWKGRYCNGPKCPLRPV